MKPGLEAEKPQGSEFVPGMRYLFSEAERPAVLERARETIKRVRSELAIEQHRHFLEATRPSWRRGMP